MPIKTKVWTVTCPQCKVEMYSRAPHDYRLCGCPNQTMIDGGFSGYIRIGGKLYEETSKALRYRFVKASKQELYDDWNHGRDKFGIISKKGVK